MIHLKTSKRIEVKIVTKKLIQLTSIERNCNYKIRSNCNVKTVLIAQMIKVKDTNEMDEKNEVVVFEDNNF